MRRIIKHTIDPFWISTPIKRPIRYLAWSEAFRLAARRSIDDALFWSMAAPNRRRRQVRCSTCAAVLLREGGAVMIFPEGGRCCPNGELDRFKNGAARIALESGVAILPVTIRGGERVWPRGWRFPRFGGKVEITYHPLHKVALLPNEDARQAARRETEKLVAVIKSGLVEEDVRCARCQIACSEEGLTNI
ncbi:MAG: lysophospholipid acyltransferase family protein [Pyrinomonadaceae bacterium]